jgi:hypothetical protein
VFGGLGFRGLGFGFGIQDLLLKGLGFRVEGFRFKVCC